jgi:uncharacterized protein YdeI (YjbR/CyaY-like superfamily)
MADDHPRVEVASRAALRTWLQRNHTRTTSIWLVTWKKSAGERHVPYSTVVDEALCFGWIDSLPRKLDAERSMVRLSPRKPGSAWSAVNKAKIERLMAEGRMAKAGLAAIERAKADGSWSLLDSIATLAPPPDLAKALAATPRARQHFDAFPPSVRRAILEWITQAKTPETRARRIAETARLAADNIRANHPRQPKSAGRPRSPGTSRPPARSPRRPR